MIETILLLIAALSPDFSFSHPERGEFEADIFSVESAQQTEQMLALLIAEEDSELTKTVAKRKIGQENEMTVTTLSDPEGLAKIAYLYRLDLAEGESRKICRVRLSTEDDLGSARTLRWCLSFIGGDEYRPTVIIPGK